MAITDKLQSYSVLRVTTDDEKPEELDIFIGKIDNVYHLLGYRPRSAFHSFSEKECTTRDLGKVIFPDSKKSWKELKPGDIIHVKKEDGNPGEVDKLTYVG